MYIRPKELKNIKLSLKDSVDKITRIYKFGNNYYPSYTYIFKCKNKDCKRTFNVQMYKLNNKRTGFCASCVSKIIRKNVIQKTQLKPFEALFNRFKKKARLANSKNCLTYKQFLNFTTIKKCHYCNVHINWILNKKKNVYNLDRIDNNKPYKIENCVVCCSICNFTKRNVFTYKEFLKIGKVIKQIRKKRNL